MISKLSNSLQDMQFHNRWYSRVWYHIVFVDSVFLLLSKKKIDSDNWASPLRWYRIAREKKRLVLVTLEIKIIFLDVLWQLWQVLSWLEFQLNSDHRCFLILKYTVLNIFTQFGLFTKCLCSRGWEWEREGGHSH